MILKKIVMLGMHGVGKTSLVRPFVVSIFHDRCLTTVGVKVDKKAVNVKGRDVTMMLWDIACEEADSRVPSYFLRGAAGYLLVIDGTRVESLVAGLDLIAQVEEVRGKVPGVTLLLDCCHSKGLWRLDDDFARLAQLDCPVVLTNAATGEGVEEGFLQLAEQVV